VSSKDVGSISAVDFLQVVKDQVGKAEIGGVSKKKKNCLTERRSCTLSDVLLCPLNVV
jgi:hypothetical protein